MNLPNAITFLRVLAAAPVILLLVNGSPSAIRAALVIMIAAELTDWLDGIAARRFGQVSALGKILDPMADSLYRVSVFTAFAANHWMPIWMFLVMVWRDVGVSYLRVVAEQSIGTMGARQSGKWKAVAQGAAQLLVVGAYAIWSAPLPAGIETLLFAALLIATLVTAYSLVDYAVSVFKALD